MQNILVTGSFTEFNLVKCLFKDKEEGTILGIDILNSYYDPSLKEYCLCDMKRLKPAALNFQFVKVC